MSAPLSKQQLAEIRALAARAAGRPFLFSDCEGALKVWVLSALEHVTRNEDGVINGYSEPGSYRAADLVAEVELDAGTWDPGEDEDDDQRRQDVGDLVASRELVPALLAELERLRAALREAADQVAERDSEIGGWSTQVAELERTVRATKAERDVEIITWLSKKAREIQAKPKCRQESAPDAIDRLASKIARGAVRPARIGGAS